MHTSYPPRKGPLYWFTLVGLLFTFIITTGCYHMIVVAKGDETLTYEQDPLNDQGVYYKGKSVHQVDTVIKIPIANDEAWISSLCPKGFFSVEYRVRFGDAVHNALHFGRKRRVWVKCVCVKDPNN